MWWPELHLVTSSSAGHANMGDGGAVCLVGHLAVDSFPWYPRRWGPVSCTGAAPQHVLCYAVSPWDLERGTGKKSPPRAVSQQ